MAARVIAAAVRVQIGQADMLVERGRLLPAGVSDADLQRLVGKRMVELVEDEAEDEPKVKAAAKAVKA